MKLFAAAPLLSQIAARDLYAQAASAIGHDPRQNVYTRLGVKTVINCRGTWTYLSGSLEFPEVRQAQVEAAQHFVNMLDLQRAVGKRLAELTGAESGIVTSGAAGAMAAATAACMAGADDKHIWQLPDTTGLKHEVIMVGGRSAFDSAIRLTGAKLVLTYSPEELTNAINDNTAMIYTTDLGDKLKQVLAISKDHKVPMLLDDAAGIPPADNAKLYARMGIDLYCFSGGKGLCGPQCSGLLLGRKDLIEAALLNCSPREGAVCRPMKVGKEEIIGCLTALETWLNLDEKKIYAEWNERVDRIRKLVETVPGVKTDIFIPDDGNRSEDFLGSASLALHHRRLRGGTAGRRPGDRGARRRQSQPGHHGARGQPESQGAQSARPHRTGFHDHQTWRRNDRRPKIAHDSRRRTEEIGCVNRRHCYMRGTLRCVWLDSYSR
jgi:L-seryl-tRNA(Ser) seleniumtransferase